MKPYEIEGTPLMTPLCSICGERSSTSICRKCTFDIEIGFVDQCDGCEFCAPELFASVDTDDGPLKVPLMEIARG